MSEKRFKVCIDSNNGVGLFDNSVKLLFIKFTNKEDAVSCRNALMYHCNLLNELYEEKEQMKKRLESSETTSNATSNYNAFLESKITTLEKENEELKKKNVLLREEFIGIIHLLVNENDELTKKLDNIIDIAFIGYDTDE